MIHYSLERLGGPDLIDKLSLKVEEDKAILDGAGKDEIRKRFQTWLASDEAKTEQFPQSSQELETGLQTMFGITPRYSYCIQVDAAVLESVINAAPNRQSPTLKVSVT